MSPGTPFPQHHKLFTWLRDGPHKPQAADILCVDKTPVDDSRYKNATFSKIGVTRMD
jgi:hypothetical protein